MSRLFPRTGFPLAAIILGVVLCSSPGKAAPPTDDKEAKERFLLLKKEGPKVVAAFFKDNGLIKMSVKQFRRTGPTKARIVLLLELKRQKNLDVMGFVTIHLRFFDGAWTATRQECVLRDVRRETQKEIDVFIRASMLKIDAITDKK
jgi:hypothetical protein